MGAPVRTRSRDELTSRREEVYGALGLTLRQLDELAETRTLTGEESEAIERLDRIAFLLGED